MTPIRCGIRLINMKAQHMDAIWVEFIKQAPGLAVLAWIVYSFLQAQEKRDAKLTELGNTCHDFQTGISEAYKGNIKTIGEVIDRNTSALNNNTMALGRVESSLDGIESKMSAKA